MRHPGAAAIMAMLVLSACSSSAAPSAAPASPTPVPPSNTGSASPQSSPVPTATSAPAPYPPADRVVRVAVTDLVVRTAPGVGERSDMLPERLAAPQLVYLFEGPVEADGYTWYRGMPFGIGEPDRQELRGWIAMASRDGEPWVEPATLDCPPPTVEGLAGLGASNLACYGDRTLALNGRSTSCAAFDSNLRPAWMAAACYVTGGSDGAAQLWMAASPAFEQLDGGVHIEGHYDDPAAQTCVLLPADVGDTIDPAEVVFQCRMTFVPTTVSST